MIKRRRKAAAPPRHAKGKLAATVAVRRAELGMTQAELAAKARIAPRTVQNIEYGRRPQPVILAAVARALGMDTGELRAIADEPVRTAR